MLLFALNQRRDQSETKGYSDPLPRSKFQHVHVPYTLTGVAWKRIETLFLLVSVSTVYITVYLPYRPCKEASPLCKTSSFTASTCISALASQRCPHKALEEMQFLQDGKSDMLKSYIFPNNYQANKLTKESGTFTSGLLGRWIANSKGYHKGGTACPTDLRSTKIVVAQKNTGLLATRSRAHT